MALKGPVYEFEVKVDLDLDVDVVDGSGWSGCVWMESMRERIHLREVVSSIGIG
ncbi:predicted protein [Sclerotinia sclerotiorum 1980 UF-70]|uniref:Uncharacterized protein n=1 Tax=Sclerotinia sclerotiorum (strain ATCC 18683 / 1980 / Ss-1) TaxID=665079 RepID=A7EAD8_SCLS1|nr:predicted protein [Sclerotinia sclerotiorum 1980 UF-70]EDN99416.1 predicted protein [Sclerotinia sclerotiorum 1980 UF-70]